MEGSSEIYANCLGCKVDQMKAQKNGVPYIWFSFIWLVSLCAALPTTSLYPFLYFMIRDFHIVKQEEDIGFYAGFLGSAFMLGRAFTAIFWGMAADRFGRKPIILIGTLSVFIFTALFGLSWNFWMALSMRFILGCFSPLLGTIRAYASEICREEHRGLSLSVVNTSRGIGLVIGPAIGGFFAMPAEKFPTVFSKHSLFGRFPYFLPCFIISVYAGVIFALCWWLPETLHKHEGEEQNRRRVRSDENEQIEVAEETSFPKKSLFRNWPLMSTIIVYCVFSLQEMTYHEIFALWAVSDKKYGGLSFSSKDVGIVLAVSGFGLLVIQLLIYPRVEKRVGPLMVTRISAVLSIPVLTGYPFTALLSGLLLLVVISVASLFRNALSVSLVTGFFILLNDSVPQHQRGAANGISMTAMSFFKAAGPAAGGPIFSWVQKRQHAKFLPGDHMIFFLLNGITLIGLLLTFKPFLARAPTQAQQQPQSQAQA